MEMQEGSKAMASSHNAAHMRALTAGPSQMNTQVRGVRDTETLQFFVTVRLSCQNEHLYPTQGLHVDTDRL